MFSKVDKNPKLVFIIEDNAVYAKTLEIYLRSKFEGIDIRIFQVGELAIDNLNLKPDFIILDYFLNSKFYDAENGVTILKAIREKDARVQVIVLSSETDQALVKNVKETGCLYLHKNEEAFEKVRNLISIQFIQK